MQGGGVIFVSKTKDLLTKCHYFLRATKAFSPPTPKIGGELGGRKWEIASRRLWGYNSIRMRTLMSRPVR